jgi:hypothetical protein
MAPGELYTQKYCPRGEMENRFKEQQLELFSDRTSTHTFAGNQLRLWFSSIAYALMNALGSKCLAKTELQNAQVGTIRTKLLKLGALIGRPHHVNKESLFSIELKIMSLTLAYCENFRRSLWGLKNNQARNPDFFVSS